MSGCEESEEASRTPRRSSPLQGGAPSRAVTAASPVRLAGLWAAGAASVVSVGSPNGRLPSCVPVREFPVHDGKASHKIRRESGRKVEDNSKNI